MPQTGDTSLTPADSTAGFTRLATGHLLLLLLILAIDLAWISPYIRIVLSQPEDVNTTTARKWAVIAPLLLDYTAFGITLFGLIVLIRERWRGVRWRLPPGHWYFVVIAAINFGRLWSEIEFVTIHDRRQTPSYQIFNSASDNIIYLIAGSMAVWASVAAERWRWRICFGLLAASYFTMALLGAHTTAQKLGINFDYSRWYNLNVFQVNLAVASCLAALAAVALDVWQGIRRDWLHYLAIVAIVLATAVLFDTTRTPLDDWWTRLFFRVFG